MTKEKVFQDLQRRIINDEFVPGSWLAERDLVAEYGLSRTPIREVLNRLVMLGLLAVQKNRGYQVRTFSLTDVVEIFNARRTVESAAARYACHSTDPSLNERIEKLREKLEALDIKKEGGQRAVALGNEVHDLIIEQAGNRYLKEFSDKLSSLMILTRKMTSDRKTIEEESRKDHLRILEALEDRNADLCEFLMDQHLLNTSRALADTYMNSLAAQIY